MSNAPITVSPNGADRYTVTNGPNTYTLDAGITPPVCSCEAYRYFPRARPCKHGAAVLRYRAEPQAALLDALTPADTLDLIDPSHGAGYAPWLGVAIDPEDRAVAITALETWGALRRQKSKPNGYYGLWRAACEAQNGLEAEKTTPSIAAERFAVAREWVRHIGQKGRVA